MYFSGEDLKPKDFEHGDAVALYSLRPDAEDMSKACTGYIVTFNKKQDKEAIAAFIHNM